MRALFLFLKFLYSKKFIKLLLIPILLLMFWAFSSVLFVYPAVSAYPASFSFITNYYDKSDIQNFSTKKVLKGERITGYVNASNDNLGILVIRFNRSKSVQYQKEDRLIFRIKEKGSDKWLAENRYRSALINQTPFFPFGFPLIEGSRNKVYEFQIMSLKGNEENAISMSSVNPIMASQYKVPKSEIFKDGKSFTEFMFLKFQNFLTDKISLLLSFPYLLPFLFYFVYLFAERRFGPFNFSLFYDFSLFYLVSLFILADIFINYYKASSVGEVIIAFCWILVLGKYKLSSSISFFLSALFVLIAAIGIIFGQPLLTEKSSEWAYYMLLIGGVQIVWEIKNSNLRLISLKTLFMTSIKPYDKK